MGTDPTTLEGWREAMALAVVMLEVHAAMAYGLVVGPAEINADRCEEVLERGRAIAGLEHWPTYAAVAEARLRVLTEFLA